MSSSQFYWTVIKVVKAAKFFEFLDVEDFIYVSLVDVLKGYILYYY